MSSSSTVVPSSEVDNDRHHKAVYMAKLGFLYHRKRERFFDLLDKLTKSLTVLLGASLLAEHVKQYVPIVGVTVSAIGLLSLIFGYSDRKQKHKELAEAYAGLQSKIDSLGSKYDASNLNQWHSELQLLNAKEPPTLGTLVVLCQNEIAVSEGHINSVVRINPCKQLLANWHDFHTAT